MMYSSAVKKEAMVEFNIIPGEIIKLTSIKNKRKVKSDIIKIIVFIVLLIYIPHFHICFSITLSIYIINYIKSLLNCNLLYNIDRYEIRNVGNGALAVP